MNNIEINAKISGLTLVRKANKSEVDVKSHGSYYLYRFNACNHEQFICKYKAQIGRFTCRACADEKSTFEIKEAGLTLVTRGDPEYGEKASDYSLYIIDNCGHTKTISRGAVRSKQFICQVCTESKFDKEAADKNLTMIRTNEETGELLPYKYGDRLYLFNKCGHKKNINMEDVRTGHFWCNECQDLKIENEAKAVGLDYLRKATIDDMSTEVKNHGFFRFKSCGHEQAISKTAVRSGHFKCNICNVSSKYKPSYVYLYRIETDGFSWLKLGFSSNPEFRGKKYQISADYKSTLIDVINFGTGTEANKAERGLHNLFKNYRLDSEYMKKYMTCSGFTECYPLEIEPELISELLKIKELNGH